MESQETENGNSNGERFNSFNYLFLDPELDETFFIVSKL
jgi:hypothetical protein